MSSGDLGTDLSCGESGSGATEALYITFLGRSVWALLNSYYAVLRETPVRPTSVVVFGEETYASRIGPVREGLNILSEAYGIAPDIQVEMLPPAGYRDACRKVSRAVRSGKQRGAEVALDITPGRKGVIAGALVSLEKEDLDHVFYLSITSTEGAALPYTMIPFSIQELKDFREAMESCAAGAP